MSKLILVGNHLGNYQDISPRAVEALKTAHTIIYEYPDKFNTLIKALGISTTSNLITFAESELPSFRESILNDLINDRLVVFIADNGYPMIADPGQSLAEFVLSNSLEIDVIPGPSISSTAHVLAVLPGSGGDFLFQELFSLSSEDIPEVFERVKNLPHNIVIVDLPHRLLETLGVLKKTFGNRLATICVDTTTATEEIVRGTLEDIENYVLNRPHLDFAATVIVSGKR